MNFQEETVDLKIESQRRKVEENVITWAFFEDVRKHDRLFPEERAAPGWGKR